MKHFTGLAHLALYTTDLEGTIRFYELLGGQVTGRAEVEKPAGTNRLAMVAKSSSPTTGAPSRRRAASSPMSPSRWMTSTRPFPI